MKVGLIDYKGKLVNLAILKLSAYHKACGDEVVLNPTSPDGLSKTYVSIILKEHREKAVKQYGHFPNVEFGGPGYSLDVKLPATVEAMSPDYDLYSLHDVYENIKMRPGKLESKLKLAEEIRTAGIGYTTRGCPNTCPWCIVPVAEGKLHSVGSIDSLLNPNSNLLMIMDNSFTADPDCLEKMREIKERKLRVNIVQGVDVRRVTPEIAHGLSELNHFKSLHMAWDVKQTEKSVFTGIDILTKFVSPSNLMVYCLCGFNSTFEEDMYRVIRLKERGLRPYVMLYRSPFETKDAAKTNYMMTRLQHFKRWVNAPKALYKKIGFNDYEPWAKVRNKLPGAVGASQISMLF